LKPDPDQRTERLGEQIDSPGRSKHDPIEKESSNA
ncbi:hypothetical protein LCGC14_0336070, partial [marine sediment metagenome]